jgi:hypothetical protein
VLSVPHTDTARHRCGTKQLFLPKVPACAAPAQSRASSRVASPQVENAEAEAPQVDLIRRLLRERNAPANPPRLMVDGGKISRRDLQAKENG